MGSGLKIYPGRGITFAKTNEQIFMFLNSKTRCLFNKKKDPENFSWTMKARCLKKDSTKAKSKKKKKISLKKKEKPCASISIEASKRTETSKKLSQVLSDSSKLQSVSKV